MLKTGRLRARDVVLAGAATLIVGVALGVHLSFGTEAVAKLTSGSTFDHFDFETFWYSAKAFWEGKSIYDTGHEAVSSNRRFLPCSSHHSGSWRRSPPPRYTR